MNQIDYLKWDSEFFRLKVGRIEYLNNANLISSLKIARDENFDLVYLNTNVEPEIDKFLLEYNGSLIDKKLTFRISTLSDWQSFTKSELTNIESYNFTIPTPELYELSIQCGHRSRFRIDPKINDHDFIRLYRRWIEKSCIDENTLVYVYRQKNKIVGFFTILTDKAGNSNIKLISVNENMRGKNIGGKLLEYALKWSKRKGSKFLYLDTQESNNSACKFYFKKGFEVVNSKNIYHFWIK